MSDLWSLPKERTKNGRAHDVPLSDEARAIIDALPRMAGTQAAVHDDGHDAGFRLEPSEAQAGCGDEARASRGCLHDLRRTLATGMQRLGIPPHVTEAVLNHKSGTIKGVAAVYARHDYADEKRGARRMGATTSWRWSQAAMSIMSSQLIGRSR